MKAKLLKLFKTSACQIRLRITNNFSPWWLYFQTSCVAHSKSWSLRWMVAWFVRRNIIGHFQNRVIEEWEPQHSSSTKQL